jgi:hypothetical protein
MSILASVIQLAVTCSCQSPGGAFVSLDLVAVEQLYEFTSNWYRDGRSERTTCQGRRSFVQGFIPLREFADLFGGHVLSEDSSEQQFLGVWGRRCVSCSAASCVSAGHSSTLGERCPSFASEFLQSNAQGSNHAMQ